VSGAALLPVVLLPVVLMRGGTSKGVFVRDDDLPAPGPDRDSLLLRLMGSPDPMQLDGLGGSHSSTSKVVAVSASDRADCDVEYLFAQVGTDRAQVDYRGNCGNLTTAVGPFAIDEGLVPVHGPVTQVRMLNRNTGTRIIAHVPVSDGRAAVRGDCVVAGVPGTGRARGHRIPGPGRRRARSCASHRPSLRHGQSAARAPGGGFPGRRRRPCRLRPGG
jgi:2-methylaconitate cis-trans-isomerase PrpF